MFQYFQVSASEHGTGWRNKMSWTTGYLKTIFQCIMRIHIWWIFFFSNFNGVPCHIEIWKLSHLYCFSTFCFSLSQIAEEAKQQILDFETHLTSSTITESNSRLYLHVTRMHPEYVIMTNSWKIILTCVEKLNLSNISIVFEIMVAWFNYHAAIITICFDSWSRGQPL